MAASKGALSSLTMWGGFGQIATLVALIQDVQPQVAIIMAGVSAAVTIFGRLRAATKIKGII